MAESHFSDPYVQNNAIADRRQQDAQKFNQMVQMLAMANRADGQTMLGFALGKLLHDTWLNYKKKRGQAEYENGANTTLGGEDETADQQTRDALQARNAAQFFHAPTTAQGVWQQTAYHGGLSPAQYYGQQLLNGKPQETAAAAQTTTSTTADGNTATTTMEAVKPAGTNKVYAAQADNWGKTPTSDVNSFSQIINDLRNRQDVLTGQTSPYGMGSFYGKNYF